jgi:hypothetical protein
LVLLVLLIWGFFCPVGLLIEEHWQHSQADFEAVKEDCSLIDLHPGCTFLSILLQSKPYFHVIAPQSTKPREERKSLHLLTFYQSLCVLKEALLQVQIIFACSSVLIMNFLCLRVLLPIFTISILVAATEVIVLSLPPVVLNHNTRILTFLFAT